MALLKLQTLNLNSGQVRRVAVASQGTLHIEINESEKPRFFVYEANELSELQPENDSKIPLAAKLNELDFAADHAIVSYRPGRRIVLGPVHEDRGVIIKAYKKHKAAQAAKNYAITLSSCEHGGFDIPELLQYETQGGYLVMTKRMGQAPVIAADAVATWGAIGSCLQRFQRAQGIDGLQEFSCRDELIVLDERARRFSLCMPGLPENWEPGRKRLENLAINLPPAVIGLTHRDLHDGQFIVAGKTISLLDFDLICRADVALDAGNLLAHMKLRALQVRQGCEATALADCSKAFLSGLGRQDEPGFEDRLYYYQATTFYRLALLYALRPRWSHLTESLITEGNRCIEALNGNRGRS